jgi:hypothetical protein
VVSVSACGGGLLLVGAALIMRWTETATCIGSGAFASHTNSSSRCCCRRRLPSDNSLPLSSSSLLYCIFSSSFWRVHLVVVNLIRGEGNRLRPRERCVHSRLKILEECQIIFSLSACSYHGVRRGLATRSSLLVRSRFRLRNTTHT